MGKRFEKLLISVILTMAILSSFLPTTTFAADGFSTATTLRMDYRYFGLLLNNNAVDYYKFTTTNNDSFYKIELRNQDIKERIKLNLYSRDDAKSYIVDLSASLGEVNFIKLKLKPNYTYYISVQKATFESKGIYALNVKEIKDDVPDTYSNSTSITLNKKNANNLEVVGDADYFKFTTTSNNSYYKIELANTEATDSIEATLYYEDDGITDQLEIPAFKASTGSEIVKLESDHTYYIVIQAHSSSSRPTGAYQLCVTEIKDDASDTFKNCSKISLNKKSTYKLEVDGDIDYFKLNASISSTYTITLANKNGNDDMKAMVYSEADITKSIGSITSKRAAKDSIKIKLKKNHTYYISVEKKNKDSSVTGAYSLTIKR